MTDAVKRRLAADVDDGFIALVDVYGPMVLSIARGLGDRTMADDVAQETFLRAYRFLRSGGHERLDGLDLRPWLATIARNVVRNEWRRRSRKPTAPLPADVAGRFAAPDGDSPEGAAAEALALDQLTTVLAALPAAQREAVVLRHVVGLSTRETADVMDCPDGTVKSHLSRGLGALRSALTAPTVEVP